MSSPRDELSRQLAFYAEHVPLLGQTILDVGANVGDLSAFFWREGCGTSRLISVEPLPENLTRLESRRSEVPQPTDGWTIAPCAVSDHDGTVELIVAPLPTGGHNSVVAGSRAMGTRREVPCRRLVSLAPDVTVVKMDIEGHEHVVLADALPSLRHVHTWALELHRTADCPLERTLGALVDHGFRLLAAGRRAGDEGGAWLAHDISRTLSWADIPAAERRADGSEFKMLHLLALATHARR